MSALPIARASRVAVLALLLAFVAAGHGEEVLKPEPVARPVAVTNHLALWQQHLTLGAGDTISLRFYGRSDLTRPDITIEPDGRISYLQVQGLMAAGLTLDELRQRLNEELSRFVKNPQVIVTPVTFKSKKFYVLGKVAQKGAYTLDRPLTILEAIGETGGLETGLFQFNNVELADLPRSFLIRNGKRMPVDFERLFLKGDMTQNVLLEPDDYLFFASGMANEVYVLGMVRYPGAYGLTTEVSTIGAITLAGGLEVNAYLRRVIVVRGSMSKPTTFVVNLDEVLAGKAKDMRLEPRDVIYVSDKPWQVVEDIIDTAIGAFVQTMASTWANENIPTFITKPFLPRTR